MATPDPLHALEEQFRQLKRAFELYFAGVESKPPNKPREQFQRQLQQATADPSHKGVRRFRLQQMQASLQIHEAKWDKFLRQIEEGTFLRDRRKAARMDQAMEQAMAPGRPSEHVSSSNKPAASEPAATDYAQQAVQMQAKYQAALAQSQPGATGNVPSVAALQRTMEQQAALLAERHGVKQIAFDVVIKDGKPILKAVAKPR